MLGSPLRIVDAPRPRQPAGAGPQWPDPGFAFPEPMGPPMTLSHA